MLPKPPPPKSKNSSLSAQNYAEKQEIEKQRQLLEAAFLDKKHHSAVATRRRDPLLIAIPRLIYNRLKKFAKKKGVIYFVVLVILTNVDKYVPWLGGQTSFIGIVLLPALAFWLWTKFNHRWEGGRQNFVFAATVMATSGMYGLLKAWSLAIGSSIPHFAQYLCIALFGLPGVVAMSWISELFGFGEIAPLPLVHEDGLIAHISNLNLALVVCSVGVLALAINQLILASVEYGGGKPELPAGWKVRKLKKLWVLNLKRVAQSLKNSLNPLSGARCNHNEIVLAAALPNAHWWPLAIKRRSMRLISALLAKCGLNLELSLLDTTPLVPIEVKTCALVCGGAGSGKTHGYVIPQLMLRDAPIVYFDVQRNASRDVPLRKALNRTPFVFDSTLGKNSASVNVLACLNPEVQSFFNDVIELSSYILLTDGQSANEDLKDRTRILMQVVIANHIVDSAEDNEAPSLRFVYQLMLSSALIEHLEYWAQHGHTSFQDQAGALAQSLRDDADLPTSLKFFVGNSMAWLGDETLSSIVDGNTNLVCDPNELVNDVGRVDWLIQTSPIEMEHAGAIWRLVLNAAILPHILRESAACEGKTRTMLLVDEIPAFGKFNLFNDCIVRHRQKGILPMYLYQGRGQITEVYGEKMLDTWEATASVKIYTQIDTPEYSDFVSQSVGQTAVLTRNRNMASEPGLSGGNKGWEQHPLLQQDKLMELATGEMVAIGRLGRRFVIQDHMPFWFHHPMLKARFTRIQAEYGEGYDDISQLEGSVDEAAIIADDSFNEGQAEANV